MEKIFMHWIAKWITVEMDSFLVLKRDGMDRKERIGSSVCVNE